MSRSLLHYFTPSPLDPHLPHPFWILSSTLILTLITSFSFALPLLASTRGPFFGPINVIDLCLFLIFPILLAVAWLLWAIAVFRWLTTNRAPRDSFSILLLLLIPLILFLFLVPTTSAYLRQSAV